MIKLLTAAAAGLFTVGLALSANAQGSQMGGASNQSSTTGGTMMACNADNMKKAKMDMDKMPAGEKKTGAMKEMGMADDMMAKKDMAGCGTHMNNAMKMSM
jgi:hypothetical protein